MLYGLSPNPYYKKKEHHKGAESLTACGNSAPKRLIEKIVGGVIERACVVSLGDTVGAVSRIPFVRGTKRDRIPHKEQKRHPLGAFLLVLLRELESRTL